MTRQPRLPNSTAWFWKPALLVAVLGGGLCTYLYQNITDTASRELFVRSLFGTILAFGVCIICASASWWLKR